MMHARLATLMIGATLCAGQAVAQSTEGVPDPPMASSGSLPDFNDRSGPDAFAPAAGTSFGYLRIAGSSFVPRSASAPIEYSSAGCVRATAAGTVIAADVQLPAGADVRYVRTYYYNMGVSGNISTFFTEFDGAGLLTQYTTFPTTGSTGYSSDLSPPLAVTVNPLDRSYVMAINIGTASTNLRFCGVRIQYFY